MQTSQNLRVDQLVRLAHDAMRARRADDAMRIWEQVLALAPEHPQALFHLGSYALFRKDAARAKDFFERAAKADPQAAAIPLNLAYACRELGDDANEMAALDRALALDPHSFAAVLAKGQLTERVAGARAAAKIYQRAVAMAPSEEEMPANLVEPLRHARELVRDNAASLGKFIENRLSDIRSRHKGSNLDRFEACKEIALGVKKAYTQNPVMLLVPWLPAIQFYDDSEFPWIAQLEAATDVIRGELQVALQSQSEDFRPYVSRPDGTPLEQWKELNRSPRWSSYFFWKDGKRYEEAHTRCPRTSALLDSLPLMHATKFGPTVMFSVLAPHTHLPAHSSATNARLIVHLPLIVPVGCRFRVGNDTRDFREGKAWVFDDTIEHEAWNDSDEYRTILILDIWNPFLSAAERDLVTALLNGMNEYYAS